jgi:hypothetical protein
VLLSPFSNSSFALIVICIGFGSSGAAKGNYTHVVENAKTKYSD